MLCNNPIVPPGVPPLALSGATPQPSCPVTETLCAMSASFLPGALVFMQECFEGKSYVMLVDCAYQTSGSEQQGFVYNSTSSFIVQLASGLCLVCPLHSIIIAISLMMQ
jgi:hypothetical protein